ncbi:MAG: glutathione S-transferase family protein [Pseudomonadales bacterium]
MKFHESVGPNPRVVRWFLREKGLEIESVLVDIIAGENRLAEYLQKNPVGQTPALELDNGVFLTEITAICEYLEELHPTPALIGETPLERAETRMWCRRMDLNIFEPLLNGFRFSDGLPLFESRLHCIPQAADDLKQTAQEQLTWLDGQLEGKAYVVGDRFTLADIMLYTLIEFGQREGQPFDHEKLATLAAWEQRISAERPHADGVAHVDELD